MPFFNLLKRLRMTFVESVKFCLTKGYAKFQGRASRSEFWWFALFGILVSFVLSFLETISDSKSNIQILNHLK